MFELIGVPPQALFGQLLLGLINGAFYALLSLGLAVIFGLMNVINFTHGAQYMMGAFCSWMLLQYFGIPFWGALVLAPIIVGATGIAIERMFISRLYHLDHLYGLLLTFGLALIIEGLFRQQYGSSGLPYTNPIPGGTNLGFMFLPWYRGFIVVFSLAKLAKPQAGDIRSLHDQLGHRAGCGCSPARPDQCSRAPVVAAGRPDGEYEPATAEHG